MFIFYPKNLVWEKISLPHHKSNGWLLTSFVPSLFAYKLSNIIYTSISFLCNCLCSIMLQEDSMQLMLNSVPVRVMQLPWLDTGYGREHQRCHKWRFPSNWWKPWDACALSAGHHCIPSVMLWSTALHLTCTKNRYIIESLCFMLY